MAKLIDLTGKKFNLLTVVERAENSCNGRARWRCLCECGNYTVVASSNLINGAVKSCGCLVTSNHSFKHNQSKTRLYRIWALMKSRCENPNVKSYEIYGGRGIQVCAEWNNNFESFQEWAKKTGYSDSMTIERIDNDKGYSPENCTWISKSEQSKNRRSCILIEYNGKTQNLTEWCKELGIDYKRVNNRMKKLGMPFEVAISKPVEVSKRNMKARKRYG